jgi:hypothetical protein
MMPRKRVIVTIGLLSDGHRDARDLHPFLQALIDQLENIPMCKDWALVFDSHLRVTTRKRMDANFKKRGITVIEEERVGKPTAGDGDLSSP